MLLESEIKTLREENTKLKTELTFLKQEYSKFEFLLSSYDKTKNKDNQNQQGINTNNYTELKNLQLKIKLKELNTEIESLKDQMMVKEITYRREFDIKKSEYEVKISSLLSKLDLLEHKTHVFLNYEVYMNELEQYNKDLLKNISELQTKYDNDMEEGKKNLNVKVDKVKKKMLDLINQTKNNFKNVINQQVEHKSKILILQNLQLFDELANQSKHLEELHIKMNEKDKIIYAMKLDLEIEKNVQLILSENNKKITEMMKIYFEEKNNKEISEKFTSTKNNYKKSITKESNFLNQKDSDIEKTSNYNEDISNALINNNPNKNPENNKNTENITNNNYCVCNCNCFCFLCNNKNNTISNVYNTLTKDQQINNNSERNSINDEINIMSYNTLSFPRNKTFCKIERSRATNLNTINSYQNTDKNLEKQTEIDINTTKMEMYPNITNTDDSCNIMEYDKKFCENKGKRIKNLSEQEKYFSRHKNNIKEENLNLKNSNYTLNEKKNFIFSQSHNLNFSNKNEKNHTKLKFLNQQPEFIMNINMNNGKDNDLKSIDNYYDRPRENSTFNQDKLSISKIKLDKIKNSNNSEKKGKNLLSLSEKNNMFNDSEIEDKFYNNKSYNQNQIINKVKKQISTLSHDKIIKDLNFKITKNNNDSNLMLFSGGDFLINKNKNNNLQNLKNKFPNIKLNLNTIEQKSNLKDNETISLDKKNYISTKNLISTISYNQNLKNSELNNKQNLNNTNKICDEKIQSKLNEISDHIINNDNVNLRDLSEFYQSNVDKKQNTMNNFTTITSKNNNYNKKNKNHLF